LNAAERRKWGTTMIGAKRREKKRCDSDGAARLVKYKYEEEEEDINIK
jgi:preprotein translocase subunit Sec61beta